MAGQRAPTAPAASEGDVQQPEWTTAFLRAFDDTGRAVREVVATALQEADDTRLAMAAQAESLLQRLEEANKRAQADLDAAGHRREVIEREVAQRREEAEARMRQLVDDTEARCAAALKEAEERRAHLLGEVASLQDQVAQIQRITSGVLDTRLSSLREAVARSAERGS